MKKLVIITDMLPWGTGERSFILPELPYLCKEFHVTILSRAPLRLCTPGADMATLPDEVSLLHYPEPEFSKKDKLLAFPGALMSGELRKEMKAIRAGQKGSECMKETFFYWMRAHKLLKWMRRQNLFADVENTIFYSYWANHSTYALAMEKEQNKALKFVSRIHGYDLYNERFPGGRQPFKEYVDKRIDKLVFIANVGYEYYMEHFADKQNATDKYSICKMGVKKPSFIPVKKEGEPFRLVSCSAVSKLKRVDLILKALRNVDKAVEWHHFGTGAELDSLQKEAEQYGRENGNLTCIFYGHMENAQLMQFYDTHYVDCFITTSSSEGCPVSIQEALSYGIPVIGTDVGEIRYMVEGNGELLPANPDAKEVAAAILKIMDADEEQCMARRKQALAIWEKDHRLEENTMKFIHTLKNLE